MTRKLLPLITIIALLATGCNIQDTAEPDGTVTPGDTNTPEEPKESAKLTGTVIGSQYSVDYDNGNAQSTTANTKDNVFDGNYETYFASYDRSRTWEIGRAHV